MLFLFSLAFGSSFAKIQKDSNADVRIEQFGKRNSPFGIKKPNDLPFCFLKFFDSSKISKKNTNNITLNQNSKLLFPNFNNISNTNLCTDKLYSEDRKSIMNAINNHYWVKFSIKDLNYFTKFGAESKNGVKIFTEYKFIFKTHQNYIYDFIIHTSKPQNIADLTEISYSYSSEWIELSNISNSTFFFNRNRLEKSHFWHLTFLTLIFCSTAILAFKIYRFYIRNKMNQTLVDIMMTEFNSFDFEKWTELVSDIFRPPKHTWILSIFIGVGVQLISIFFMNGIIYLIFMKLFLKINGFYIILFLSFMTAPIASFITTLLLKFYFTDNNFGSLISSCTITLSLVVYALVTSLISKISYSFSYFPIISLLSIIIVGTIICFTSSAFGTFLCKKFGISDKNLIAQAPPVPLDIPKTGHTYYKLALFPLAYLSYLITKSELRLFLLTFWNMTLVWDWSYLFIKAVIVFFLIGISTILIVFFSLVFQNYKWQWLSFIGPALSGILLFNFSRVCYNKFDHTPEFSSKIQYYIYSFLMCLSFSLFNGSAGYISSNLFTFFIYRPWAAY